MSALCHKRTSGRRGDVRFNPESRASASTAGDRPPSIAVSRVRSAASRWRQTHAPAVAVLGAKQRDLPHNVCRRYGGSELTMEGFCDHEAEVVGEAIRKALTPMRGGIGMTDRGVHPDFAITQFDRELRYIVCPKIKGDFWGASFDYFPQSSALCQKWTWFSKAAMSACQKRTSQ
jgi:hypothetical protein